MSIMHPSLLAEIDRFLSETGMGESYFGKSSVGNSEVVKRLREGKRVWPDTEARIRSYILARQMMAERAQRLSSRADAQDAVSETTHTGDAA